MVIAIEQFFIKGAIRRLPGEKPVFIEEPLHAGEWDSRPQALTKLPGDVYKRQIFMVMIPFPNKRALFLVTPLKRQGPEQK